MAITTTDLVSRADGALSTVLDRRCVLFDMEGGKYIELNEVGTEIWARLETPTPVADLCRGFHGRFEASDAQIEADVLTMLNRLEARGLLVRTARG